MRKIDEWMPLYVSRYLTDTVLLDNAMSGSYLHALMYLWVAGPLPNDMDQCARIMKIEGLGSPELAHALLKKFFEKVTGTDGDPCWIQKRAEKIKADFTLRAVRYRERSRIANESRWRGHVAKYPSRTPKTENGILKGSPQVTRQVARQVTLQGLPVVQVIEPQDQESSLRSLDSQPQASGTNLRVRKSLENGVQSNGHVKNPIAHLKMPQDASKSPRTGKSVTEGEKVTGAGQGSRKKTPKNEAEIDRETKRQADPRFVPFRREFQTYWKELHSNGLAYVWDVEDGRALNNLLRKYKAMDFAVYKALLVNRAQSDNINPSEAPARWLGRLMEYASGPLNEYRRPKSDTAKVRGRGL